MRPFLGLLTACTSFLTAVVIIYYKQKYTYWKKRNLPYIEPSIPFGNLQNPLTSSNALGTVLKNLHEELRRQNHPHGGLYFFARHIHMVVDVDNIEQVLSKDFHHFVDRRLYYNERDDPISAHLFSIGGKKWRNLRVQLSTMFTSGRIKAMFEEFVHYDKDLLAVMDNLYQDKHPIDIKEVLCCFATDVIGRYAFDLNCNTLKHKNSPFRKYVQKFFAFPALRLLTTLFTINLPNAARSLKMKAVPKDVSQFFNKVLSDVVEYREKNSYARDDYMQLLINMRNDRPDDCDGKTVTIEELIAQSFLLFAVGIENPATAVTWALYELAKNKDIQDKLREEINHILCKSEGGITYDGIQEMKYMHKVFCEALRKYPPIPFLNRQCVKDYNIPGQSITIEKGTRVVISILGIHYDSEYYPDPEKFDPERFDEEKLKSRHPCSFIPFGRGPRMCLGFRFATTQAKIILASLVKCYEFTLNDKTKEPIKFAKYGVGLQAEGDIWLNAKKINQNG